MYIKNNRAFKQSVLSLAATNSFALPESGILSALKLDFEQVNASGIQGYKKARIIDHLTKIEVTDGGTKALFSLTGQELKALDLYALGKIMPEVFPCFSTLYQRSTVVIPFGAFVGDPKMALDLAAWDEVNLEITNDYTTTYVAAEAAKVDVNLITLEDLAAKPGKYYKHYEWRAGKPAAAAQHVYHDLPTAEKIRRYFVQIDPDLNATGYPTYWPETDTNNLKFSFLSEKETVWDHRPKDIMRANSVMYGRAETFGRYHPSTTQYYDLGICYVSNTPHGGIDVTSGETWTADTVLEDCNRRFCLVKAIGTGVTVNQLVDIHAIGEGYYNTMMLYDAMSEDEMTFLNPSKEAGGKGPVRTDWYATQADHTLRSCLTVPMKQGEA